ncbi:MAG: ABC transporter substrate-binding protein [Gammaproteobacteria bacterium]|nr:ABC transporter substrate-binding protein [Gammaproteobacteria bacterium]
MRYLWGSLLLLSLALAFAAEGPESVEPPVQMLERVAGDMLSTLRRRKTELRDNPAQLRREVETTLVPHVDLELLSRFVLGRHWRTATPEQRQRFSQGFKDMLIRFYASSMLEYGDYDVRFYPLRLEPEQRHAVVRSEFYRGRQTTAAVNYRVVLRDGQWKVYDVTIDNISVVTNYRGSFDAILKREGMEALLQKMEHWNQSETRDRNTQQQETPIGGNKR